MTSDFLLKLVAPIAGVSLGEFVQLFRLACRGSTHCEVSPGYHVRDPLHVVCLFCYMYFYSIVLLSTDTLSASFPLQCATLSLRDLG